MRRADGRQSFLHDNIGLCVQWVCLILERRVNRNTNNRHGNIDRHDAKYNQRKLPLDNEGHHERGDEGRDSLDSKAKLLGDATIDGVAIGSNLAGH